MDKEGPSPTVDADMAVAMERDWTDKEEKKARFKLDFLLMPLLASGYFFLQLDKGNIANAITANFMEDVGITQNQFNVGQQLLSLGIVLFEFPSNLVIYRVGPARWLTAQIFLLVSGTVSCFQAFQTNYVSFMVTRFLLGTTEAGYGPGALWAISTWYKKKEIAKRVMIFYFGIQLGAASSKLLAFGILHMKGVADRSGWFWLFVIMGSMTCLNGLVFGLFFPDSSNKPNSAFLPGVCWFNDREIHILKNRVLLDDPMKGKKKKRIGLTAFEKLFLDWRMWTHFLITLSSSGPARGFDTYAPTIVRSLGFEGLKCNALASVGLFIQIPVAFGFSWISDKYNRRGETVIAGMSLHMLSYIFDRIFSSELKQQSASYFGVVFTQIFGTLSNPLNVSWMSLACDDSEQRALAMSLVIMGANIGGIYGAQLFRADDAPQYRRGFSVACAIIAFGVACAICRYVIGDYMLRRRRLREERNNRTLSMSDEEGGRGTVVVTSDESGETFVGTDEVGKKYVAVRERSRELRVVDSAGAGRSLEEMELETIRRK